MNRPEQRSSTTEPEKSFRWDSIETTTWIGLRDRALIGTMVYSFARVSAAVTMRVGDYFQHRNRLWLRLHEKGCKRHEVPCVPVFSARYTTISARDRYLFPHLAKGNLHRADRCEFIQDIMFTRDELRIRSPRGALYKPIYADRPNHTAAGAHPLPGCAL